MNYLDYAMLCNDVYSPAMESTIQIENHGSLAHVHVTDDKMCIVFRGTTNFSNVLIDLQASLIDYNVNNDILFRVHSGFLTYYNCIRDQLIDLIQLKKTKEISFTGHSLGACVLLCAIDVFVNIPNVKIGDIMLFASPKIGDNNFVNYCDTHLSNYISIINGSDIINHLPPFYSYKRLTNVMTVYNYTYNKNYKYFEDIRYKCIAYFFIYRIFYKIFLSHSLNSHSILIYIKILQEMKI